MVWTNFECWANGGGNNANIDSVNHASDPINLSSNRSSRDLFNPRAVSQISSNGYYGYSHVHDAAASPYSPTPLPPAQPPKMSAKHPERRRQGLTELSETKMSPSYDQFAVTPVARCFRGRKRIWDENGEMLMLNNNEMVPATEGMHASNAYVAEYAKRMRLENAGTKTSDAPFHTSPSLLFPTPFNMDIEAESEQEVLSKKEKVDEAEVDRMSIEDDESQSSMSLTKSSACSYYRGVQIEQEQVEQQQQQEHPHVQQQQQQEQPHDEQKQEHNHHQYHHNQHFQGHLHRTNRDVSRCMMHHMI